MPKILVLNEGGFSTYHQRHLDARVKLINLEKRTFEALHASQCRKVVQRFTRNMMLTDQSNKSIEKLKISSNYTEPEDKLLVLPSIIESKVSFSRYYDNNSPPMLESNLDFEAFEQNQLFQTETPFMSRQNTNLFSQRGDSDLNNDVSESRNYNLLKPANNNAKSVRINDKTIRLPEIFNEQKRTSQKRSKRFMNSLGDEDSGLFYLTNAKGVPMYDGFDNYGHLQASTLNRPKNCFEQTSETEKKTHEKPKWKNPFDSQTPLPSIARKNSVEQEEEKKARDLASLVPSSAAIFNQAMQKNIEKEEEKVRKETFKAQNIPSLTMPRVDIY